MASNSLLALLNLSSSGASPSKQTTPSSPPPTVPPHVVSPPPAVSSPNVTANTLLQSILVPSLKKQQSKPTLADQQAAPSPGVSSLAPSSSQGTNHTLAPAQSSFPPASRSPLSSPQSTQTSSNDLLALLSGTGNVQASTEEDEGDISFHEQTPRSRLQPIGTPPNQSARQELSKSPTPSPFDTATLFDLLRQPQEKENGKETAPRSAVSPGFAFADEQTTASRPLQSIQPVSRTTQAVNQAAYTIKRSLHASHHLSGLHASVGFEDPISDGLSVLEIDGIQQYTLDLGSPQPAGLKSLYPAKLEITPISLLTTTFAPSCFTNAEDAASSLARWPSQRVAGMGGNIVMYVMSKGRVRAIDQVSGDRILARADSTIRSVFASGRQYEGPLADNRRMFGAITEKGCLWAWLLKRDFGQSQEDAPVAFQLCAESGKTFLYAQWVPKQQDKLMLVVQSDGLVASISVPGAQKEFKKNRAPINWDQCPKTILAAVDASGRRPVGVSVSSDGTLFGIVEAGPLPLQDSLQLRLTSRLGSQQHSVSLPSPAQLGCNNVSFTSFADQGDGQLPRVLLIGFDDNQVIAVVDISTGLVKQVYNFKATGSSFSLAEWHPATSSLILCCSIRSSIFSLRLRFAPLPSIGSALAKGDDKAAADQSDQVLYRIKHNALPCNNLPSQPALRECALPEPYTSFALDATTVEQGSIRMLACHLGGIHALLIPKEALTQSVLNDKPEAEEVKDSAEEEEDALASHNNAPAPPARQSEEASSEPERIASRERAVTPPFAAAPAVMTSEAKPSVVASKQGEARKKSQQAGIPAKSVKASMTKASDSGSSIMADSDVARANKSADISTVEIKSLFNTLESNLIARLQAQTPSNHQSSDGIAQALADQLTPSMTSIIQDVVGPQVRSAVDSAVSRCLASELHDLLLRPDLSNHLTGSIISGILPSIQKTAMDVVSRVLAPHFETVMGEMAAGVEAKIIMGLTGIRKDIVAEQSKALVETEAGLKEMTIQMGTMARAMEMLLQQNNKLELALNKIQAEVVAATARTQPEENGNYRTEAMQTPAHEIFASLSTVAPSTHTPHTSVPFSPNYHPAAYQGRQPSYQPMQPFYAPAPSTPTPVAHHHPQQASRSSNSSSSIIRPPGMTSQEVEDVLLSALSSSTIESDIAPLQSSLTHIASQCGSPVFAIWDKPAATHDLGKPRISQAVILTLLHRLVKSLKSTAENQQQQQGYSLPAEFAVPWIEACAAALDKSDEVIARYYNHIKREMTDSLIHLHRLLHHRTQWWTEERLAFGILRFIQ